MMFKLSQHEYTLLLQDRKIKIDGSMSSVLEYIKFASVLFIYSF
jgi:hypothetical protein